MNRDKSTLADRVLELMNLLARERERHQATVERAVAAEKALGTFHKAMVDADGERRRESERSLRGRPRVTCIMRATWPMTCDALLAVGRPVAGEKIVIDKFDDGSFRLNDVPISPDDAHLVYEAYMFDREFQGSPPDRLARPMRKAIESRRLLREYLKQGLPDV
jgi:hypothetical protein